MGGTSTSGLVSRGEEALRDCDFEGARAAFGQALLEEETPEALDGLGRALWWLRDVESAVDHRERAYVAFRARGDDARAARVAMWIAREQLEALGNEPLSRGWLARAEGLVRDAPETVEYGRLALERGRLGPDPIEARPGAEEALHLARRNHDPDLEAEALAVLGLALTSAGDVDEGMARLDEAMVVVTGGEVRDPEVFGDVCCLATRAGEESGEVARLMRWNQAVMGFMERSGHAPLLEFCGTCCAEVLVAAGNLGEAEGWLLRTLKELEATGHRSRCIHPAAKLAELRILQGRTEEAERLLAGYEDRPDALRAAARVHLEKGETAVAASLLLRRLNQVGDGMLAVPLLSLLVDVRIAQGDAPGAVETADRLAGIAARAGTLRLRAAAGLANGRARCAAGDPDARALLEGAVDAFTKLEMPIEAVRARTELARTIRVEEPELAAREARVALETAEAAGAAQLADEAAALLRELGGPARTGPKGVGLLTQREVEVLRLVGEGLTNAEIAARLYISTKTAGHHVSSILSKLQLRSRTEAAAYAGRHLDPAS